MPNYLNIPIFVWPINWGDPVNGQWNFDLRETTLGFGTEIIDPMANYIVTGWEVITVVRDSDIDDLDTFLDGIQGRAFPFWLPGPPAGFKIAAGINSSSFKILEQGASLGVTQRYLVFSKLDTAPQYAKILTIATNGDGTETVTLTAGLGTPIDQSWTVSILYLVRLADDQEDVELMAERFQRRSFKMVELPNDYLLIPDSLEEISAPVYLYLFSAILPDGTITWTYTSHPQDLTISATRWKSAAIEHDGLSRSVQLGGTVNISGDFDTIEPLRLSIPVRIAAPLLLEILKTDGKTFPDPISIFKGVVRKPSLIGLKVKATGIEFGDILDQQFPGFVIKSDCNYQVFDIATCKLNKADFQISITIIAQAGRVITIEGDGLIGKLPNVFAQGWIEINTGLQRAVLFVMQSDGAIDNTVTLVVSNLLNLDIPLTGIILPGCDGQRGTCIGKFNNLVNFGGHTIPLTNLTLSAIQTNNSNGGKK